MDSHISIKVTTVSKDFKLPHQKVNSLKKIFTGLFKKRNKSFDVQHALKDISFEVKKGEFFGIVGRNGSGKSTLLKILAEIYRPTNGSVSIDGRLVPFIELGVGFNPELTGRENVYLNGALLGFSEKEIDAQYEDIVSFAELESFMDQKLKNYSSGMQVRLAFSVATRAKAEILLIDEVLAVGDADFQRKCFNYFKQLKRSKTTVVFVSHDMDAVREYCDRALLIEKSEIVDIGDTDKIAQKYSKLFSTNEEKLSQEVIEASRWGNGDVVTNDIKTVVTDELIKITQNIKAVRETIDPTLGIRIRSMTGAPVTGSNTKIEKLAIGQLSTGQHKKITWSVPNIFSDGDYYVDTAIHAADGITVLDWWDEAGTLQVRKARTLPYLVDPGFSVED